MEVLGHSSIRVTMGIYTFVRLDTQRAAFDRVGDVLARETATDRMTVTVRPGNGRDLGTVAVKRCCHAQRKRPSRSIERASCMLCTRQDSNLQPSDP